MKKRSLVIALGILVILILAIVLGNGCGDKCVDITCPEGQFCNPLDGSCVGCDSAEAQAAQTSGEEEVEQYIEQACGTPAPFCSPEPGPCEECVGGSDVPVARCMGAESYCCLKEAIVQSGEDGEVVMEFDKCANHPNQCGCAEGLTPCADVLNKKTLCCELGCCGESNPQKPGSMIACKDHSWGLNEETDMAEKIPFECCGPDGTVQIDPNSNPRDIRGTIHCGTKPGECCFDAAVGKIGLKLAGFYGGCYASLGTLPPGIYYYEGNFHSIGAGGTCPNEDCPPDTTAGSGDHGPLPPECNLGVRGTICFRDEDGNPAGVGCIGDNGRIYDKYEAENDPRIGDLGYESVWVDTTLDPDHYWDGESWQPL